MIDFTELSLALNGGIFAASALMIGFVGWHLALVAGRIADQTGLGQAVVGALLLGAVTSLSGSVTSLIAALDGRAGFAVSNGLGGIAAQTAFIALADIAYRKANLEHAAASLPNIMHGSLLVVMLSLILLAMVAPPVAFFGVHPVSPVLLIAYLIGLRMVHRVQRQPMWQPRQTAQTRQDVADPEVGHRPLAPMLLHFALLAVLVSIAGWLIARSGLALAEATGLSDTAVGGVLTAVSTSLPELVTAIAAVRQGNLTLAVGDIIGGNVFDTLFVAIADVAYRSGSALHADGTGPIQMIIAACLLQTGILLIALIRRQRGGVANIGMDSLSLVLVYLLLVGLLMTS